MDERDGDTPGRALPGQCDQDADAATPGGAPPRTGPSLTLPHASDRPRPAPSPLVLARCSLPRVPPEAHTGALLLVSSDRFGVSPDQWWASQASVFVPDQAALRARMEAGTVPESELEALVRIDAIVPLSRSADRLADVFVALLERALGEAGDRALVVRVSEGRWATVLRDYQWLFPTLHLLPGHDPLVARLSAACMRIQIAERRRFIARVNAHREWATFSGSQGRGHVAVRGADEATAEDPLVIASDGAHNPRRGATWGYFTSRGGFRLGVCDGSIAVAELQGLMMAVEDHPGPPLVVWTDSRRVLSMLRVRMRSGIEPVDRQVARRVRDLADLIEERREGGQPITVKWVRAHSALLASEASVLNDAADRMAKLALRRWCTPGLSDGMEQVALTIAREAAENLRRLVEDRA